MTGVECTPGRRVVVVGAGHNGLVAAAYLARAGLSVTVVETRPIVGGATVTEEVFPGFRASTCAFVLGLFSRRLIEELELKRFGLELFQAPDALGCAIDDDGTTVTMWRELDRTVRDLERRFGAHDASAFLRFGRSLQRFGSLMTPHLFGDAPDFAEIEEQFADDGAAALFESFVRGSVEDLVGEYFESPLLRGYFAFPGLVSVYGGPRTQGTAYVLAHHSIGEFDGHFGQWGFVRGGMGGLASALAASATAAGARIRTDAEVQQIVLDSEGAACAVVLGDGEEIKADFVIATCDPTRTLVGLVGRELLGDDLQRRIDAFDQQGSMARVFLALDSLPTWSGSTAPVTPAHRAHVVVGPSIGRYQAAWEAAQAGSFSPDAVVELRIESVLDPDLVPRGKHLIVAGVQQLPHTLDGRTWDDARDDLIRTVVDRIAAVARDVKAKISATHAITPLDLERTYGLTGGNIYHGALWPHQLGAARPVGHGGAPRSPIPQLYLGGAGSHPGGGVTGVPGRNAASAVLTDAGLASIGSNGSARTSWTLVDGMLGHALGERLALTAAKSRWLRPLLKRATRVP